MSERPIIEARGLIKAFDEDVVLDGVDLTVGAEEVVGIIGPSGGGKSTLLRCLNLLETPDAGTLALAGEDVAYARLDESARARHRARVGMVFQHFHLFEHLSVLANLTEAPMGVRGLSREEAVEDAQRLLERVGLGGRGQARPHELSGGQKQRVAIARALAMRPDVILLDEVTSALDVEVIKDIHRLLFDIAEGGMTLIAVTHDLRFARAFADRLVFMDRGRVVEQGPADRLLDAPETERLRAFVDAVR